MFRPSTKDDIQGAFLRLSCMELRWRVVLVVSAISIVHGLSRAGCEYANKLLVVHVKRGGK